MGTLRPVRLNLATGELELAPVPLLDEQEASTTAAAGKIPRAGTNGQIDDDWLPLIPLAKLPVADDGEVSETKLVRADDGRLGNPPVGGDLSGTAAAATVIGLRGRTVANAAPLDGNGLVWNAAADRWEPGEVSGGSGDATQIQGRDVASAEPANGDALVWNAANSQWEPSPASGGSSSDDRVLIALALVLQRQRPFG